MTSPLSSPSPSSRAKAPDYLETFAANDENLAAMLAYYNGDLSRPIVPAFESAYEMAKSLPFDPRRHSLQNDFVYGKDRVNLYGYLWAAAHIYADHCSLPPLRRGALLVMWRIVQKVPALFDREIQKPLIKMMRDPNRVPEGFDDGDTAPKIATLFLIHDAWREKFLGIKKAGDLPTPCRDLWQRIAYENASKILCARAN